MDEVEKLEKVFLHVIENFEGDNKWTTSVQIKPQQR
jgi:hypothetical protein